VIVPGFHPRETSPAVVRALRPTSLADGTGLLEARRLLEASDISVEEVAQRPALGTASNVRLHLAREIGTTPTAYRSDFRGAPTPMIPEATSA
jgi:transcriptional regulator GlxA family with amidase domain